MQTEGDTALLFTDAIGHERVAGGGAKALAHPVGEAHAQHSTPRGRQIEEGLGQGRDGVARHRQPFAIAQAVG